MRSILMFGPPCCCNAFVGSLLNKSYGEQVHVISTGDLLRDEMKNPSFRAEVEEVIRHKSLIQNETITRLVQRKLTNINNPRTVLVLDGFRTLIQLEWLEKKGLLSRKSSAVIVFQATEKVCYSRALDRKKRQPDSERLFDSELDHNFKISFDLFTKTWPSLDAFLRGRAIWVNTVDANGDIERDVFPEVETVLAHVQSLPISESPLPVSFYAHRRVSPRYYARA